ncbi:MAG: ISAs1 family transposase [Myxococcales bacterium]|nr:ISAs1 family transposase [Myxococcales bacterium]
MTPAALLQYFAGVPDPRIERSRLHPLASVLILSLCAVICGADSFVAIERFGRAKEQWLKTFLDLPNGVPSHDTLGRIFAALDPAALAEAFRAWVSDVSRLTSGEVVAIDGKTLRRSFLKAGSGAFVHMVSAWATTNRVVLGQVKTDDKSNEITAIPRLLRLLHLRGCLVTIDAMGCQKEIAEEIVNGGADYLLAVKDNQPKLREDLVACFERARTDEAALRSMDFHETRSKGHGRTEHRRCWTSTVLNSLSTASQWHRLSAIVLVEVDRCVDGKTSTEQRYYITSSRDLPAAKALDASRRHWGIENSLHWVLDVAFGEDDCRVRIGNAAENFAVIRHLALNMLKSVKGSKVGVKTRRMLAGWDDAFRLRVLTSVP